MKKILLTLLLSCTLYIQLLACSCFPIGPFCQSVSWYTSRSLEIFVVEVKLTSFEGNDMYVEVLENLLQEIPYDTIKVVGQDGLNCNEVLSQFAINDRLILALLDYDPQTDAVYDLSICGRFYLRILEDNVLGKLDEEIEESISYEDFLDYIPNCTSLIVNTSEPSPLENIKVFPNPASSMLWIDDIPEEDNYQVSIMDNTGRVLKSAYSAKSQQIAIDIQNVPNGLYFIRILSIKHQVQKKVIIY